MIRIHSYTDINGVRFGSTEADVVASFGEPNARRRNHENEQELHFADFIVRFDTSTGRLREFTLLPECVATINGRPVDWALDFLRWLADEDTELVEALGFVLSLKLGVAVSGFHGGDESQKAIHAFNRGDWDMFRSRMRPFTVNP